MRFLPDIRFPGSVLKRVFSLERRLKEHPEDIEATQALTLNMNRPNLGLCGDCGLYGSDQWWSSVLNGAIPQRCCNGIILERYAGGMDSHGVENSISVRLAPAKMWYGGMYANDPLDADLFRVGHRIVFVLALDKVKSQPARDGGVNYAEIMLEMAVSMEPVDGYA